MVRVKIKKKYIEEIDRILNTSGINYIKDGKYLEINSNLYSVKDLFGHYVKFSEEDKEKLKKETNIPSIINEVVDTKNPDSLVQSYIYENNNDMDSDVEHYGYDEDEIEDFYEL